MEFKEFIKWLIQPSTNELLAERNNFLIYLFTFTIIILFTILFFYYSHNKIKFSTEIFTYTMMIIIPISILFYFLKPSSSTNIGENSIPIKGNNMFIIFAALLVFGLLLYYVFTNITPTQLLITKYIFYMLIGLIVLVALSMIFLMFIQQFRTTTGWSGFFIRLFFYIPCLLIDFVQYIKNELKITANTTYILFIIELLLILGYLYVPSLLKIYVLTNNVVILKDARFLNKENIIALPREINKNNEDGNYRQNFAISLWVYINPQSNNFQSYSTECNIMDMNDSKPKIAYINNIEDANEKDKIVIYFNDNKYTFSNEGQKWNNIVMNVQSTVIDVFINGNLEKTFHLKDPLNYNNGIIKLGSNNGLDGAICNIMYYKNSLTKNEITNGYNLLMFSNPPIFE